MSRDRARAEAAGRRAELLAIAALMLKGYRLLARRFRSGAGEIDLIMLAPGRPGTVAFIEVKHRADPLAAAEALHPRQRARIVRAAAAFIAARPHLGGHVQRFDLVVAAPGHWPRHVRDAWQA